MRKIFAIDGTLDEVKVSCPVWRGGKSGDNFKGLPITIDYDCRRVCTDLGNSGYYFESAWHTNSYDWFCVPQQR